MYLWAPGGFRVPITQEVAPSVCVQNLDSARKIWPKCHCPWSNLELAAGSLWGKIFPLPGPEWGSKIVFSAHLGLWGKDRPPKIQAHETTQWFRLEKTFKNVKSITKPCPSASQLHLFSAPSGMIAPPLPWAAPYDTWQHFQWRILPYIQSKHPLVQLEAISFSC